MKVKELDHQTAAKAAAIKLVLLATVILIGIFVAQAAMNKLKKNEGDVIGESISKADIVNALPKIDQELVDNTVSNINQGVGTVMGLATDLVRDAASKSAEKASDYVFDQTAGALIKQINRLPADQVEDIKRNLCQ